MIGKTDDKEVRGRGIWIRYYEWAKNVRILAFHLNAHEILTSEEDDLNNAVVGGPIL